MCGIVGVYDLKTSGASQRSKILELSKRIRHRGPDWSGIYCSDHAILAHERLTIVDPQSGGQPLYSPDGKVILAVNGEIYNHQSIRDYYKDYQFQTKSDCEVILALYQEKGVRFLDELTGMFAFALYDSANDVFLCARDHQGIIPLYYGTDDLGQFYVASELKALEGVCNEIAPFPPGHYYHSSDKDFTQWYYRDWKDYETVKDNSSDIGALRKAMEASVHRHLMSDVPYGVLLSGGLDSSIVSAIAKKYASTRVEEMDKRTAWWPQLHSFAIGLEGSPDLAAAQLVADHIGTVHHSVTFTVQEGLDAIKDVIYYLETYDVTTVRASTPMYLLARVIKSMGIKMVLSGEGSDEIFGGYLYFHKAPNAKQFHEETVRKLDSLHLYDNLRANKSLAAWGIEGRVPFLDKEFIDVAMQLNPKDKMCGNGKIEKHILRKAFEDYLPKSVAWRQKEQFSDGVGYTWIDSLKETVDQLITATMMDSAVYKFKINPPQNKEEYYYRSIFEGHFPSDAAASCVPSVKSVACSTPTALEWDIAFKNMNDPSGRAVAGVHDDGY